MLLVKSGLPMALQESANSLGGFEIRHLGIYQNSKSRGLMPNKTSRALPLLGEPVQSSGHW